MSLLGSIVILLVANGATVVAMLFVRRRAPEGSYFKDGDRASGVFGVLAGAFAIFAGFIISSPSRLTTSRGVAGKLRRSPSYSSSKPQSCCRLRCANR